MKCRSTHRSEGQGDHERPRAGGDLPTGGPGAEAVCLPRPGLADQALGGGGGRGLRRARGVSRRVRPRPAHRDAGLDPAGGLSRRGRGLRGDSAGPSPLDLGAAGARAAGPADQPAVSQRRRPALGDHRTGAVGRSAGRRDRRLNRASPGGHRSGGRAGRQRRFQCGRAAAAASGLAARGGRAGLSGDRRGAGRARRRG